MRKSNTYFIALMLVALLFSVMPLTAQDEPLPPATVSSEKLGFEIVPITAGNLIGNLFSDAVEEHFTLDVAIRTVDEYVLYIFPVGLRMEEGIFPTVSNFETAIIEGDSDCIDIEDLHVSGLQIFINPEATCPATLRIEFDSNMAVALYLLAFALDIEN